jgi:hypothetical protein
MQSTEYAHLQEAGLFDYHSSGVALPEPDFSMLAGCLRNRRRSPRVQAQTKNEVPEEVPQMPHAFCPAEWNARELGALFDEIQPGLNRSVALAFQD